MGIMPTGALYARETAVVNPQIFGAEIVRSKLTNYYGGENFL